ncbi:polyketide synthase dehydratase domain-containing protein [Streptomyces sp. M10(2022)]
MDLRGQHPLQRRGHLSAQRHRTPRPHGTGSAARHRRVPRGRTGRTREASSEEFYRRYAAKGNQWRGVFKGITRLWCRDGEALARIEIPEAIRDGVPRHHFHPALLDACGHTLAAVTEGFGSDSEHDAFVLGGINRVRIHRRPSGPCGATQYAPRSAPTPSSATSRFATRTAPCSPSSKACGCTSSFLRRPARTSRNGCTRSSGGPRPRRERPSAHRLLAAVRRLRRHGRRPVRPHRRPRHRRDPGSRLPQARREPFRARPASADGYRTLLTDVREETGDAECEGVVHLWARDADDPEGAGDDAAARVAVAERLGCHSVLHLFQAMDTTPWPAAPVWLVTEGAQHLPGQDGTVTVGQSMVWGFGRSLIQEYSQWRTVLVDLPAGSGAAPPTCWQPNCCPRVRAAERAVPRTRSPSGPVSGTWHGSCDTHTHHPCPAPSARVLILGSARRPRSGTASRSTPGRWASSTSSDRCLPSTVGRRLARSRSG